MNMQNIQNMLHIVQYAQYAQNEICTTFGGTDEEDHAHLQICVLYPLLSASLFCRDTPLNIGVSIFVMYHPLDHSNFRIFRPVVK